MLASKSMYPASLGQNSLNLSSSSIQTATSQSSRRQPAMMAASQTFSSPTESEFSDLDGPESAKNWDEDRVCDWLSSVNCREYEKLFRKNNINGENLLEMDKAVLQEMGIDKIGDRVRLFLNIKKLRTRAYANQKKRNRVRTFTFISIRTRQLICLGLIRWTRCIYPSIQFTKTFEFCSESPANISD